MNATLLFRLALPTALASVVACTSAISTSPGGGQGTGSCPCTVGNAGIHETIGCGESACLDLNGTVTGYRCESDGTHEDPTVCENGGSSSGSGGGSSSGSGGDASLPPTDAGVPLPDGAMPGPCEATGSAGTCASYGCQCMASQTCSFGCGTAADAGTLLMCTALTSCNVDCAGDCDVNCLQSKSCNATIAGSGSVNCTQSHGCTATVGPGDSVDCTQATSCNVTCKGACNVGCVEAGTCRVTCAGGLSGCDVSCLGGQATTCADGVTKICGAGPC